MITQIKTQVFYMGLTPLSLRLKAGKSFLWWMQRYRMAKRVRRKIHRTVLAACRELSRLGRFFDLPDINAVRVYHAEGFLSLTCDVALVDEMFPDITRRKTDLGGDPQGMTLGGNTGYQPMGWPLVGEFHLQVLALVLLAELFDQFEAVGDQQGIVADCIEAFHNID